MSDGFSGGGCFSAVGAASDAVAGATAEAVSVCNGDSASKPGAMMPSVATVDLGCVYFKAGCFEKRGVDTLTPLAASVVAFPSRGDGMVDPLEHARSCDAPGVVWGRLLQGFLLRGVGQSDM